jgi:hypothetical protein
METTPGTFARFSKEDLSQYEKENKILFGKKGKSVPSVKNYSSEIKQKELYMELKQK